jgi:N-acetyl-gamma-glutamyl-phosphate reductase
VVIVAAEDNLGKGAAGQAVQNANIMFGLAETTALDSLTNHAP